jgi:serine/threonine protein kinase
MQGLSYDFKADIWSIGVVFYQMLYGKFPIQARSPMALLEKARNHDYSLEGAEVGEDCKDFITRCLKFDPEDRINWADIYRHPLIADENN